MGDIGKEVREYEFEPIPDDIPVPEIVPEQTPVTEPAEPEKVPA